jgi:hypothetical protein
MRIFQDFMVSPGSAEKFPAFVDILSQKPSWKDATMQGLIQRLRDDMAHVKKDMTPYFADSLASSVIKPLEGMTPSIAQDITKSPVYQALSSGLPSSKAIIYPDWFFLASIYGPDHVQLRQYRDYLSRVWGEEFPADKVSWPHALSKFYCEKHFPGASTPQGQNGPGRRVSATTNAEGIPKHVIIAQMM